jgi:hypothetical protein
MVGEAGQPGRPQNQRLARARILGFDIVGPLVVYRLCRSGGVPQVWSLVLSGCLPGVGVLIDYLRWRTLEIVGAVVLGGIALSVTLALISGSTKAVLLEGAGTTAAFGVACFVSLSRHRPLLFYFIQAFYGGRHSEEGQQLESDYAQYDVVRHFFRTVTVVWGVAYLVEAVALAVIVQVVSTGTALAFNRIAPWVVSGLLFAWSYRWGMRLRAQRPAPPAPSVPA